MDTVVAIGFAGLMLAIVVVVNKLRRRKVDIDPNDPHVLRVGAVRFRLDWAVGRMIEHSERLEETASLYKTSPINPHMKGEYAPGPSAPLIVNGVVRHERFVLDGPGTREEFAFSGVEGDTFGWYKDQRMIILWLTVDGERRFVRFHSYDAKATLRIDTRYWQLIEKQIREPVWTAIPAALCGWVLAATLGLWGIFGGVVGLVIWFLVYGIRKPPEQVFERDYLYPLIEKLGAAGA